MEQRTREAGLGFAVALAALVVFALVVFAWLASSVARGATIGFDAGVRVFVHQYASPELTRLARALSALGSPASLSILGGGALVGMLALRWYREALRFLLTLAGAILLDGALKAAFQRARPESFFDTPLPASFAFPSGHALFSACFFGSIAALAAAHLRGRAARRTVWAAAGIAALSIGLSRIYLGVHFPSDVLAGYAVAAVWLSAIAHAHRLASPGCRARAGAPESHRSALEDSALPGAPVPNPVPPPDAS